MPAHIRPVVELSSASVSMGRCGASVPNRILRDGILTSERVARLGWPAEVFYRRLMSVVDDFGRYYASPMLLRAACYPLHLDKVSDSDIGKWLAVCAEAGLVRVYPAKDGKRYLQMLDFRQQVRATASKFPQPPPECAADAQQMHSRCTADAHLDVSVDGDVIEDGDERERRPRKRERTIDCPSDVDGQVWQDWLALRKAKKAPVTATVLDGARAESDKAGMPLEAFLRVWCARGSQGFMADWLKPDERGKPESFRERDARAAGERAAQFSPRLATHQPITLEAKDVIAIASD